MRQPQRLPAALGLAALMVLGAGAAGAQATLDELTVMGHGNTKALTKSHPVSYRDIDLRTKAGAAELERRVEVTAEYVCAQLGLMAGQRSTCRRQAVFDASLKVQAAVRNAKASKVAWKPGPPWKPPPVS